MLGHQECSTHGSTQVSDGEMAEANKEVATPWMAESFELDLLTEHKSDDDHESHNIISRRDIVIRMMMTL